MRDSRDGNVGKLRCARNPRFKATSIDPHIGSLGFPRNNNAVHCDCLIACHFRVARPRADRNDSLRYKIGAGRIEEAQLNIDVVSLGHGIRNFICEGKCDWPCPFGGGAERKRQATPVRPVFFAGNRVANHQIITAFGGRGGGISGHCACTIGTAQPICTTTGWAGIGWSEHNLPLEKEQDGKHSEEHACGHADKHDGPAPK